MMWRPGGGHVLHRRRHPHSSIPAHASECLSRASASSYLMLIFACIDPSIFHKQDRAYFPDTLRVISSRPREIYLLRAQAQDHCGISIRRDHLIPFQALKAGLALVRQARGNGAETCERWSRWARTFFCTIRPTSAP